MTTQSKWQYRQSSRYRFFTETGFLLYGQNKKVLLDGQVLEFCDPYTARFNPDFTFVRSHVLMSTPDLQLAEAEVELDPDFRGKDTPVRSSQIIYIYPDSILGFTGAKHYTQPWAELSTLMDLRRGANWTNFCPEPDASVARIFPSFYVAVEWDKISPALQLRAMQLFNLQCGELGWFLPLVDTFSPFVAGLPLRFSDEQMRSMESCLRLSLASVGKIFIGISSIAPVSWRRHGMNVKHPFYQFVREPCLVKEHLPMIFESDELKSFDPARNYSHHIPVVEGRERKVSDSYFENILNGPARAVVRRLTSPPEKPPQGIDQLLETA